MYHLKFYKNNISLINISCYRKKTGICSGIFNKGIYLWKFCDPFIIFGRSFPNFRSNVIKNETCRSRLFGAVWRAVVTYLIVSLFIHYIVVQLPVYKKTCYYIICWFTNNRCFIPYVRDISSVEWQSHMMTMKPVRIIKLN